MPQLLERLRRLARRPPGFVARRAYREAVALVERHRAPGRARRFDDRALLNATRAGNMDTLWARLAARPFPARTSPIEPSALETTDPGGVESVRARADLAQALTVTLLGSAPTALRLPIDWSRDFKSGLGWPRGYFGTLPAVRPDDASDVKVPWELSRLQWLIPAGQAYLVDRDDRHARLVRDVLVDWIAANPYACSINWGCAMEAALRIVSWSFFFHVFHASAAWSDPAFRSAFLRALYLHADFVERHLELSDINGNHFTADAAGLAFAGLFFGEGTAPERWAATGWRFLTREVLLQVGDDGVDFEASTAYHRLVLELFLLPALYRTALGLPVSADYQERLRGMARFVAVYTGPDGRAPHWGDADDGRVLPMSDLDLNDHRYLIGLVGLTQQDEALCARFSGPRTEIVWLLGPEAASRLAPKSRHVVAAGAFERAGVYVLGGGGDHVFVDAGPVGFAGRGGHGHNDCLSFEATLDGLRLVTDCGSFTYTSDLSARDRFRSTASHNTPRVGAEELNRILPGEPWFLENDAAPEVRLYSEEQGLGILIAAHSGYRRLAQPITPVRTLALEVATHRLLVRDAFEGPAGVAVEVPLHLAPGVAARRDGGRLELRSGERAFVVEWAERSTWELAIEDGQCSPSYGIAQAITRLVFRSRAAREALLLVLAPFGVAEGESLTWARDALGRIDRWVPVRDALNPRVSGPGVRGAGATRFAAAHEFTSGAAHEAQVS